MSRPWVGIVLVIEALVGTAVADPIEDARSAFQRGEPCRSMVPLTRVDPVYPRSAIRAGISDGKVVARIRVDEMGKVDEVKIVSAHPPRHFDGATIDALKQWKYPARGEICIDEIETTFTLR